MLCELAWLRLLWSEALDGFLDIGAPVGGSGSPAEGGGVGRRDLRREGVESNAALGGGLLYADTGDNAMNNAAILLDASAAEAGVRGAGVNGAGVIGLDTKFV